MYTLRLSPTDGLLLGPINKVVWGSFAGKRFGFAWARRQAEKRGFAPGSNKLIQFVSDGDDDFPIYLRDYFGEYSDLEFITTIDLPHVMEYLWDAGLARYQEGTPELAAWAHEQKARLLENHVDRVLAELRVMIGLPPLRSRGGDILLLAQHFLDLHAAQAGKNVLGLSPPAAEKLFGYSWPGNVRELQNCIERAVALTTMERVVVEDLPEKLRSYRSSYVIVAGEDPADFVSMEEVERRYVLRVLEAVGGNKAQAAQILGFDRRTLYRKLERYAGGGKTA